MIFGFFNEVPQDALLIFRQHSSGSPLMTRYLSGGKSKFKVETRFLTKRQQKSLIRQYFDIVRRSGSPYLKRVVLMNARNGGGYLG